VNSWSEFVEGYFSQWKRARGKKGDSRWDGQAVQSVSLFCICLNALPNPLSAPIDEKGKRPARA
jgi:hypothetical protein